MTDCNQTHLNYPIPVCDVCGAPQSFRGVWDLGTGHAEDLYHCMDEGCEGYAFTHTYNRRPAPVTNKKLLARMAAEKESA